MTLGRIRSSKSCDLCLRILALRFCSLFVLGAHRPLWRQTRKSKGAKGGNPGGWLPPRFSPILASLWRRSNIGKGNCKCHGRAISSSEPSAFPQASESSHNAFCGTVGSECVAWLVRSECQCAHERDNYLRLPGLLPSPSTGSAFSQYQAPPFFSGGPARQLALIQPAAFSLPPHPGQCQWWL